MPTPGADSPPGVAPPAASAKPTPSSSSTASPPVPPAPTDVDDPQLADPARVSSAFECPGQEIDASTFAGFLAQGTSTHDVRSLNIDGAPVARVFDYTRTCTKLTGCGSLEESVGFEEVQLSLSLDGSGGLWLDSRPWPAGSNVPSSARRLTVYEFGVMGTDIASETYSIGQAL